MSGGAGTTGMESRLIEIPINQAVLFLTESEIQQFPAEVLARGLRRGKRILRARQLRQRMEQIRVQERGT